MSELALELVLPLLRETREMRLVVLALLVIAADEDLDGAIERLEQAASLDPKEHKELSRKQRAMVGRIGKFAREAAEDLKNLKERGL